MTNEMKSRIMKRAHENAKAYTGISYREALSRGLRAAWALYKANGTVGLASDITAAVAAGEGKKSARVEVENTKTQVKAWFINKNFNSNERQVIACADTVETIAETAKAVRLCWTGEYGNLTSWVLKSCLA